VRYERVELSVINGGPALPSEPRATSDRVRSTLQRVGNHLVNGVSTAVGDDIVGRTVRRGVLRIAGAGLRRSAHLMGGIYFSRPANLRVGERCLINRSCYLDLHGMITVGDDVVIGHGTAIITSRHHLGPEERRAGVVESAVVTIGAGAWVGANVTILPGVTVGRGAVVAAGAVVIRDVPANSLVAGVPARVVRKLDQAAGLPPGA
jgi:maltose O-acetyltransferase